MVPQEVVFEVIKGERAYQDSFWNADSTPTEGKHTVSEFVLYMEHYLGIARGELSTQGEPKASEDALNTIRKIAGLAVACMEQNGAPRRVSGNRTW